MNRATALTSVTFQSMRVSLLAWRQPFVTKELPHMLHGNSKGLSDKSALTDPFR
jgi:hypothetical protein